jgi:hypothetical protein
MLRLLLAPALGAVLWSAPVAAAGEFGDPRPLGAIGGQANVLSVAPDGAGGAPAAPVHRLRFTARCR